VRPFFPIFLILTFWVLSVYAQQAKDSTEREPKNSFEVFINGKRYKVVEGEVLTLDTTLSKPSISIRLSDRKKFETPSLSFEYPKHLSFEYEKNPGIKTWTLTGNSLVVMLFEFEDKTPLDTLTDALAEKFGKKNCVAENFKKELGHQLLNGKRLHVTLAGTKLNLDFYEFNSEDSKTHFISFQDTLKDDGDFSDEFNLGFQLINNSIRFSKLP
jgi:hypothetical protein